MKKVYFKQCKTTIIPVDIFGKLITRIRSVKNFIKTIEWLWAYLHFQNHSALYFVQAAGDTRSMDKLRSKWKYVLIFSINHLCYFHPKQSQFNYCV